MVSINGVYRAFYLPFDYVSLVSKITRLCYIELVI